MVIDCNIEVGFCHTGGMQMSVHAFCLSSRRAVARMFLMEKLCIAQIWWYTPYQRRETIGLAGEPRMAKPRRLT